MSEPENNAGDLKDSALLNLYEDMVEREESTVKIPAKDFRDTNGGAREGAGRPKNKRFNREAILKQLAFSRYDPLAHLIRVAKGELTDSDMSAANAANNLLPYILPKLKSVEIDVKGDMMDKGNITILQFGGYDKDGNVIANSIIGLKPDIKKNIIDLAVSDDESDST